MMEKRCLMLVQKFSLVLRDALDANIDIKETATILGGLWELVWFGFLRTSDK